MSNDFYENQTDEDRIFRLFRQIWLSCYSGPFQIILRNLDEIGL